MPPEKKLLLPVPGDTTELLYFLIYITKIIITLCFMLGFSKSLAPWEQLGTEIGEDGVKSSVQ